LNEVRLLFGEHVRHVVEDGIVGHLLSFGV
jgi:hypothetical protein